MTSSLRARLAAESWKRLWPDGKPNSGQFGKRDGKSKNILTFEDFAQSSFKVSPAYAKMALAILNHSPELLEDAKAGLAEAWLPASSCRRSAFLNVSSIHALTSA
jgi:hypothetical protein